MCCGVSVSIVNGVNSENDMTRFLILMVPVTWCQWITERRLLRRQGAQSTAGPAEWRCRLLPSSLFYQPLLLLFTVSDFCCFSSHKVKKSMTTWLQVRIYYRLQLCSVQGKFRQTVFFVLFCRLFVWVQGILIARCITEPTEFVDSHHFIRQRCLAALRCVTSEKWRG